MLSKPFPKPLLSHVMMSLVLVSSAVSASEGPSNGGGGDVYGLQFKAVGKKLLYRLQATSGSWRLGFNLVDLERAIERTRVVTVEQACLVRVAAGTPCPKGQARDAVNYADEGLIELTGSRWAHFEDKPAEREDLVLHEYFGILNIEKNVNSLSGPVLARLRDKEMWSGPATGGSLPGGNPLRSFSTDSPTQCVANYYEYRPDLLVPLHVERQFKVNGDDPGLDCTEAERRCSEAMNAPVGRYDQSGAQNRTYCERVQVKSAERQCEERCDEAFVTELKSCDSLRHQIERDRCRLDLGAGERSKACYAQCDKNAQWKPILNPVVAPQPQPPLSESCAAVQGANLVGIKQGVRYAVGSREYLQIKKFMQWADCANGEAQVFSLYDMNPDRGRHGIPSAHLLDAFTDSLQTLETGRGPSLVDFNTGHSPEVGCSDRVRNAFVEIVSPTRIAVYSEWIGYRVRSRKCETTSKRLYKRALYHVSTETGVIRFIGAEFNELDASADFWGKRSHQFFLAVRGKDDGLTSNTYIEGLLGNQPKLKKWLETTRQDILSKCH